jgi:RND superfamily putative drug exporter
VLAIKAVVLNLLSLAAAFGIVVFIFQQGHGSSLWDIAATQSVTAWIPVMIFAFLFGLSMDYEVFMLTRMREAYDETGSTDKAIELGLAAGIILDATVVRALLVPALMRLLGDANWWMPRWTRIVLRTPHPKPAPESI